MHDTDRGANPTAVRLAALTALRNAQAEGSPAKQNDPAQSAHRMAVDGGDRTAQDAAATSADDVPETTPPVHDSPVGVYAAVEAAVKRSRMEFLSRLTEYRRKLDCDAFEGAGTEGVGVSLDEAQFVAHRIAGVGKTLGFTDLGDQARQAEAAITAYKLESSADLRQTAISRVCKLVGLIEATCAEHEDCKV